jgi:hypothetical protein
MGVSFDRTGSYKLMLVCYAFAQALASLPLLRLGAYAYPAVRRGGEENAPVTLVDDEPSQNRAAENAFDAN